MQITYSDTRTPRRSHTSALGWLNAAALGGVAITLSYLSAAFFGFDLIPNAIIALCLASAALIFTGWRWAPLPGLLPGVAIPALFGSSLLAEPGTQLFLPGLLLVGCGALVGICSIAGTIQNYRHMAGARPLPRWIAPAALLITGLLLGAALVARVAGREAGAAVSPEVLSSLPSLTTQNYSFSQPEMRVEVGQTVALRLENADPAAHSFDIDALNVHVPILAGNTAVALFRPTQPGIYTLYCAPHFNTATGEGMQGRLIVEPSRPRT